MIKIAIDVIKAELLAIGLPSRGLTIGNEEKTIADEDPNKISEIIKENFFSSNFCMSFCNNHYQF